MKKTKQLINICKGIINKGLFIYLHLDSLVVT